MKSDMNDLKKLVLEIMQKGTVDSDLAEDNAQLIRKIYKDDSPTLNSGEYKKPAVEFSHPHEDAIQDTEEIVEESLSLEEKEKELITKALNKHRGKRKYAAEELGISERTLYRKIKEYDLNEL